MTAGPADRQRMELDTCPGRACPRCGGEILAAMQVPHGWAREDGHLVQGMAEVLLCERCDRDDPITGPVVTFFTVHEQVTAETADQLAVLLHRWADHAAMPEVDRAQLDAEVDAWRRGDL